jgi:hypothetical protein
MQASKIEPGTIYALRIGATEDKQSYVARFKVESVESHLMRRHAKATSADYTHKIHGTIDERDVPPELLPADPAEREKYLNRAVDPSRIEDDFQSYQELKDRDAAEKKAHKDRVDAREKLEKDLVKVLFLITGLKPVPKEKWSDSNLVQAYDGVKIKHGGVQPLLDALLELMRNQKTADK